MVLSPTRAESKLSARSPTQPLPSLPPPPATVQEQPPGAEDSPLTEPQRPAQLGRAPATDQQADSSLSEQPGKPLSQGKPQYQKQFNNLYRHLSVP